MIEELTTPPPLPSMLARTVRWALWLLLSAWVVVAMVWGGLHFLIVPRIADLRPWIEQQATQTLGVPVRIGALVMHSNGLIPSVALNDVRLLDAQGREALRLPSILAAFSPRSLLGGNCEQLYVDSPVLDIRRTVDGALWVAGLKLASGRGDDQRALDWLFSQFELAIRHGTVTWTDEMRGALPLTLTDLDWVLRSQRHTHSMRLDATPPPEWGARASVLGVFKQPLFSSRAGAWQDWQGQLYANFDQVDLAQLRRYADMGVDVTRGHGALRAWVDVDRGTATSALIDLALHDVNASVDKQLEALAFRWVAGRMGARTLQGGYELSTQALEFDLQDGLHWPGGNVRMGFFTGGKDKAPAGELEADRLDLAALAEIAARLPMSPAVHTLLSGAQPRGVVQKVRGSWQGPLEKPVKFSMAGRVEKLAIAALSTDAGQRPGLSDANIDFDLNEVGGKAVFALDGGALEFPGIFEDERIPFEVLRGEVQWKPEGGRTTVLFPSVRFGNADAQGEVQIKWQSAAAPAGNASTVSAGPGTLDLQGILNHAELNRVHRYLPVGIDKSVRYYVRDSIVAGTGSAVKFKVKGNLQDFPFHDPRQGEFRIAANLQNAHYAYVPVSALPKESLQWPALTQLSADFLLEHAALHIKGARANVMGSNGLLITKADGLVDHLYNGADVSVSAEARGPLGDVLNVVNGSPLGALTNRVLAHANAAGNADYRFKLALPLAAMERATVQGSIALSGNELQVTTDTPRLSKVRGTINFSETGFSVTGVQARALGGDVRIEGGLTAVGAPTVAAPTLRMQGTASAEGLRQAKELGFIARLAQSASGGSSYTATLGLRAGVPELLVNSSLVGMALNLPAPFAKPLEEALPLCLETSALRAGVGAGTRMQDQLQLSVGTLANVVYVRDLSGPEPRVLRGAIGVGLATDESMPLPEAGVVANINMGRVDLDAWSQVLSQATGTAGTAPASGGSSPGMAYLPTGMVVRARELSFGGRQLHNVLLGGGREGMLWRANLDASELNGYLEYRQSTGPTAGRLYARLARLAIGQSTAQDVENLLDEQPASIPALDIVVDDFELRGKKLGRVDIEAVNLGVAAPREVAREWRLNRFNVTTPEFALTASGNWTNILALTEPVAGRSIKERRRTAMKFKLDIANAGALLERFAMPGVVRNGQGKIEGRIGWMGSPITFDYPSMSGDLNINVENGQFLKTDPGIAKLFGVLSLQSLPRRLALDFRDVFSEGFAFDFLRGDVTIEQGIARTNNLQMKGVNAAVVMEGQADIAQETQLIKVLVVPEINAGSASLIASAINPLVGLSSFLAQLVLRGPLMDAATQEFLIDGTWIDPRVTKVGQHPAAPASAPPKAGVSP